MGSDGDAWDGKIVLPLEPRELLSASRNAARKKSPINVEIKSLKQDEVRFLRYKAPLHPLVLVSWALMVMAATTDGQAIGWRSLLACLGILAAVLVPFGIGWSKRLTSGKLMAATSAAICCALLAWTYVELGSLPFPAMPG
jgi:hypothetical protein